MNLSKSAVYSELYEHNFNMKKLIITTTLSLTILATGYAQTKKIAHRSHSGAIASLILSTPDNLGEVRMNRWVTPPTDSKAPAVTVDSSYFQKFVCPVDSTVTPEQTPIVDPTKTQKRKETKEQKKVTPGRKTFDRDSIADNIQIIGAVIEVEEPKTATVAPQAPEAEPQVEATDESSSTWIWVSSLSVATVFLLLGSYRRNRSSTQQ